MPFEKKRLWIIALTSTAVVAILSIITTVSQALGGDVKILSDLILGILGSAIFGLLTYSVERSHRPNTVSLASSKADAANPNGLETGFYAAMVSLFALVFIMMFWSSILASTDRIEHAGQLHFTDAGYIAFQLYLGGAMLFAIWLPMATLLGLWLGVAGREIGLRFFLGGAGVGVAVYFVGGLFAGLVPGFGNSTQTIMALGGEPFTAAAAAGPTWLAALVARLAMLLLLILIFALYPWSIARTARAIAGVYRRWKSHHH